MAYSQPRNILRWISRLFIAGFLSIIIGAIFYDIPASDTLLYFGDRYTISRFVSFISIYDLLVLMN